MKRLGHLSNLKKSKKKWLGGKNVQKPKDMKRVPGEEKEFYINRSCEIMLERPNLERNVQVQTTSEANI